MTYEITLGEAREIAERLRRLPGFCDKATNKSLNNIAVSLVVLDDRIDELEKRIHNLERSKK